VSHVSNINKRLWIARRVMLLCSTGLIYYFRD
jgi:hypothetical protein